MAPSNEANLAEIRAKIVSAFDTHTFRMFLLYQLNINASHHVGNVGLEELVDYYLGRSIQHGVIGTLIAKVAEARPERSDLQELARKYANTPLESYLEAIGYTHVPDPKRRKPHNLPFLSLGSLFKGRDPFLLGLRRASTKKDPGDSAVVAIQAIHGLGGVGKTRTAIEYAWTYFAVYSALFYVPADSRENLRSHLAALSGPTVLDLPEAVAEKEEVRWAAVLRWFQDKSGWLLILDNVDTPEAAEAVEQLLPQFRNGSVLITSRLADWGPGVEPLELDVLDPESAAAFLLERTASKRRGMPTDSADATALASDLGGLALALEQAGAFIVKHRGSLADYRERWRQHESKVLEWFDPRTMKYPRSVATTWHTSFDELSEDARALLQVLAWLAPEPIPREMPQRLKPPKDGVDVDVESAFADLAAYSLIRWEKEADAFNLHRLVQEITRYRMAKEDRSRWLEWALQMVDDFVDGDPQDVRTWGSVYEPSRAHIAAVVQHADVGGLGASASRLMNQLAVYVRTKGLWLEAEPLFRRALAINAAAIGPHHPDVATGLHNLAGLLRETNRLGEAEPLYRRALAIAEASFGARHPEVATGLNNLAALLRETNRLGEAEPLFRRALAIDEEALGPHHPHVARDLNNLALLLVATRRLGEAEPLYRRALAIDETAFGPHHPEVATDLNNLALLLQETNRLDEAEPLFRRALAIDETTFGPNHPLVANRLNNLAGLLGATNRLDEAEPLYRRTLAIVEAAFGPHHTRVATGLNNLAGVLRETNRPEEAEPRYQRALAIDEAALGLWHPDVARDLNNLALLLVRTDRWREAEPLFRRAVTILMRFELQTGHQHPRLEIAFTNYTACLIKLGMRGFEIERRHEAIAAEAQRSLTE